MLNCWIVSLTNCKMSLIVTAVKVTDKHNLRGGRAEQKASACHRDISMPPSCEGNAGSGKVRVRLYPKHSLRTETAWQNSTVNYLKYQNAECEEANRNSME